MTSVELGDDWERTEVLHKKFEEFLADLAVQKERVNEVNRYANERAEVRWGITEPIQEKGSCCPGPLAAQPKDGSCDHLFSSRLLLLLSCFSHVQLCVTP